MKKPSLSNFAEPSAPVAPAPKPEKHEGEVIVNMTFRLPESKWHSLVALTQAERTKIQPFLQGLVAAEFERRGLRF